MSSPPFIATPKEGLDRRRGRRIALVILAICAAPIVLGTLAFYLWSSDAQTTSYGALLPPQRIPIEGIERLQGKWLLVNLDHGACDEACRRDLFTMRQARTAQGRDRNRVERVWLITDNVQPSHEISTLTEAVRIIHLREPSAKLFPASDDAARDRSIYLIDPLGNLMLRFPPDPDPRRLIKDLARLLKISRIG